MSKSKKSPRSKKSKSSSRTSDHKNSSTRPDLSILIPVYNTENYLSLCLETILNQSFTNFEAIIIDDGSTDRSPEILSTYAKKDSRLKIFTRKNAGYGASLNFALTKATGKYIGIVEPDDFIHRDFYQTLISAINTPTTTVATDYSTTQTNKQRSENILPDLAKCSFQNYFGKTGKTTPERIFHHCKFAKPSAANHKTLTNHQNPTNDTPVIITPYDHPEIFFCDPSIWSCVYRHDFLTSHKITFLETPGASFQDSGFQFKTFASATHIACIEKPLYYYRRDNASSSVKSIKKPLAIQQEFNSVDKFLETTKNPTPNSHYSINTIKSQPHAASNQNSAPTLPELSAAARFHAYIWNLNRLHFISAFKFASVSKADYRRLKKQTPFRANFYKKLHLPRAGELTFATRFPHVYVIFRPAFTFKNFLKRTLFKLKTRLTL